MRKSIDKKLIQLIIRRMELLLLDQRKGLTTPESFTPGTGLRILGDEFISELKNLIDKETERILGQKRRLIAFQGEHGAYSEMAALSWSADLLPIPCQKFSEIFEGVERGVFSAGVIPVENSAGGVVNQANRYFLSSQIFVTGAVELPIHHCLLAPEGTRSEDLRVVYSHTQALDQCRRFLTSGQFEPRPFFDTAGAAKMIAEQKPPSSAAIASELAAELYNLSIIEKNIEDLNNNSTRFLIISSRPAKECGSKCSLLFSTEHKAGTLFRVLEVFARRNLNLTRIESIPNNKGGFAFFLDFIGKPGDDNVNEALKEVESITIDFRLLGNYEEIKGEGRV